MVDFERVFLFLKKTVLKNLWKKWNNAQPAYLYSFSAAIEKQLTLEDDSSILLLATPRFGAYCVPACGSDTWSLSLWVFCPAFPWFGCLSKHSPRAEVQALPLLRLNFWNLLHQFLHVCWPDLQAAQTQGTREVEFISEREEWQSHIAKEWSWWPLNTVPCHSWYAVVPQARITVRTGLCLHLI